MKIFIAIVLLAAISSSRADDVAKTADTSDVAEAKKTVLKDFKDPESAQFRNVESRPFGKTTVVCGEVNGKNGYGGYVGFKKFAVLKGDEHAAFGGDPIMDSLIELGCPPAKMN